MVIFTLNFTLNSGLFGELYHTVEVVQLRVKLKLATNASQRFCPARFSNIQKTNFATVASQFTT
jgi:hypothetical protein